MADAQLSVELTAKIDALRDGFNQAVKEAGKWDSATQKALNDVDKGFEKLANDVERSSNTVSKSLAKAAVASATSGKAIVKGSDQAAFALTNLGRVAQDAPFGFVGIQNNLNPLLESFQRLQKETGSSSLAFKALTSQLLGPAGFGFALSLVGSAIVIYQQYQQRANKETSNAKKVTEDYISTLDQVTQARLKGSQGATKELTDLKLLYGAYTNANLSLTTRQSAYKQLQEAYPQYFGNLKFEQQVSEKTRESYDKLTTSILATAKARAAADIITKNSNRQLENEQKINDLLVGYDRERAISAKALNQLKDPKLAAAAIGLADRAAKAEERTAVIAEQIRNLKTDTNILTERNLNLVQYTNEQLEKGAKLQGSFGSAIEKAVKVKPKLERTNNNTLGNLPELLGFGDLSKPFLIQPRLKIKPLVTGLNELTEIANNAEAAIDKIVSLPGIVNLTSSTLGKSFEAMGEALAQGGDVVLAAGQVLQSAFADLLSALGQQFITMGAAKVAAGILATPFGGKLIADGAGLIALGAGLSLGGGLVKGAGKGKSSGGVTAFANGGVISGPTLGLMGEYAGAKSDPEVVAPLSKLKKMLGQQDANGNAIAQSPMMNTIVLESETRISGNDILVITKQAQKIADRKG